MMLNSEIDFTFTFENKLTCFIKIFLYLNIQCSSTDTNVRVTGAMSEFLKLFLV